MQPCIPLIRCVVPAIALLIFQDRALAQHSPCGGPMIDPIPSTTFTWTTVANADGYIIQLDTTPNFTPVLMSAATPGLTAQFGLMYGKHYYWHVAPTFQGSWGSFSFPSCELYTIAVAGPPIAAPSMYTADGANGFGASASVGWAFLAGAADYEYQFSTSSTLSGAATVVVTTRSFTATGLSPGGTYYYRIRGRNSAGSGPWTTIRSLYTETVATTLNLKVFLQGPLVASSPPLMSDGLRSAGVLQAWDPYTNLNMGPITNSLTANVTAAQLAVTGDNAIVDWVLVEVKHGVTNVAIRKYAMLVQRDGDVMMPNGSVPSFTYPMNPVRIAVRHRNHLGIMAGSTVAPAGTALTVDLTQTATSVYGTNPTATVASRRAMWAGDVTGDGTIKYTGLTNDRDPILTAVGGTTPNSSVSNVYDRLDVNMDGSVKYTGANNDRDPILLTVGSTIPTNTITQQLLP